MQKIPKPAFGNSESFKVTDVDKFKKPVTSARHYKQHVRAYFSVPTGTFLLFVLGDLVTRA